MLAGSRRQFCTAFILTVSVVFYPRFAFTGNFECSPNAYPVKNFAGHVGTVQDNARNLANFMHGAEWRSLNENLQTDLGRLRNLPTTPPLYSNKPVTTFLQEVVNNSTIFNWQDNALNHGRGTASVLRDVERDLRNQRMRVLEINNSAVAAMRGTIADAQNAPDVLATALGMLTALKNRSEEIRDTYFNRAFSHLSSCLASCAGPKGYDLVAFRASFAGLYGNATSKTFVTTTQALGDARTSVEALPHALQALISETPTDSFSTTVVGAQEAANLKNAADQLADAQRGSWSSVGEQNEKIRRAIGMLSVGFGWRADGRPGPLELITTSLGLATKAQTSIDDFVQVHSKLFDQLQAFLDQYKRSYQPGCRPNDIAAGSSINLGTQ
jgi:hypothetical protein